jgi:uncharacterized protein (TIGR01777 family)
MNVLLTGASGLIGSSLAEHLPGEGHELIYLQRAEDPAQGFWKFDRLPGGTAGKPIDAVIHLAGENIASGRWTASKKKKILDSRVQGTAQLAKFCAALDPQPEAFICASAIGYYGNSGETMVDETSPAGSNFVAEVCQAWEQAAQPAAEAGIRVVYGRIGMVLSSKGGTLSTMLPSFRLGIAGVVGSGRQYLSWVHIKDLSAMFSFLLSHKSISGPVNLVAPAPLTNRVFTKTLGKVVKRPTVMKMPAFVARTVFGQMADELILSSTGVIPNVLKKNGYQYHYPNLEQALADCINESPAVHSPK